MIRARSAVPDHIEADDDAGRAAREHMGREAYELNVQQFCCEGLNYGYYYDQSPIIVYDDETPPAYSMGSFTASTVPGCRAPHFWLPDGRSLYDALGQGYTLLRLKPKVAVSALVQAAAASGMPLTVLDIAQTDVPQAYRHALVLVREDQHIAWRGDALPEDANRWVAMLCGAQAKTPLAQAA